MSQGHCRGAMLNYGQQNERKEMIVKHSLEFETVIDESHEVYAQIVAMPEEYVKAIFEDMLKQLVAPSLEPILEELNKNGSFAILRLAE